MRKKLNEIDSQKAFERHQKIIDREKMRRQLLAENVFDLNEMFETQEYKVILGFDPPPVWSGYLSQIEIYYSRAKVERWRKIVEKLVKSFGFDIIELFDIPESRLEDIARNATTKEQVKELLLTAKTNTPQDWKDTLAEFKGLPTSLDCKHSAGIFKICSKCGMKEKVELDIKEFEKLNEHKH